MQVSYLEVGACRSLWSWLEARPVEHRAAEATMAETCGGRGRRCLGTDLFFNEKCPNVMNVLQII